jgi:hypothetical protein
LQQGPGILCSFTVRFSVQGDLNECRAQCSWQNQHHLSDRMSQLSWRTLALSERA